MSTQKPASARPVVVVHEMRGENRRRLALRMLPAALASVIFHGVLLGLFLLLAPGAVGSSDQRRSIVDDDRVVEADRVLNADDNPFKFDEIDPSAAVPGPGINNPSERIADLTIPGQVNPHEMVGKLDGSPDAPRFSVAPPPGWKEGGMGGAIPSTAPSNDQDRNAVPGGGGGFGKVIPGGIQGRSAATRMQTLTANGGSPETEARVTRGLAWLIRVQLPNGSWTLNHPGYKDQGQIADDAHVAATAFGLLPLLGAGKTHKAAKDNDYDKPIDRALKYLLARQHRRTGFLGNGAEKASQNEEHYAHALATIALCECFGLTQDPMLRRPAQLAVSYIVMAQHPGGGWRYRIGEAGDLSVSGWMIMALKSGQMAGLDVPPIAMSRAQMFLNASCDERTEGYSYTTDNKAVTSTMTAVGLLARQYIQGWGPQNRRLLTAIDNQLTKNPPTAAKNIYYHYYATQVMFHFGGNEWMKWNESMRGVLLSSQENDQKMPQFGSWSSAGDPWGSRGGRLMQTSLNLLTLEVYYRYLPLYQREAGAAKDAAVGKAIGG